jgi:hypothetical protein
MSILSQIHFHWEYICNHNVPVVLPLLEGQKGVYRANISAYTEFALAPQVYWEYAGALSMRLRATSPPFAASK